MCMGGGASIQMPNTAAYDSMLQMQQQAMMAQMNGGINRAQSDLQAAIRQQESTYRRIADQKTAMANDAAAVNEQAMRMAQLMGPPPPEKTAASPKVGDTSRYGKGAEGKKALRIGKRPTSTAAGSGLNITGG
mgnify:CR=1 FL=1